MIVDHEIQAGNGQSARGCLDDLLMERPQRLGIGFLCLGQRLRRRW
jgi:hypothetical protein